MPTIDKPCNVVNTYNFKQDVKDRIGHVTKLKIADTELKVDQAFKNPMEPSADAAKKAGAIESFSWEGGYAQPLMLICRVSNENSKSISVLLHQTLPHLDVELSYFIYEYDPVAKKYFEAIKGEDLKGLIQKQGGELSFQIADRPNSDVIAPENYSLFIAILPKDTEQAIHVSVADTKVVVKKWGVTVG